MLNYTQLSLEDVNEEYAAFLNKFKPKKTTDDCYTPGNIYDAIADWVAETYNVDRNNFVRPFWPGGDYERYPYKPTDIVVDNPPFSIISAICNRYISVGVKFFLFAPYLTCFGGNTKCCSIITGETITYENGAVVDTAFKTNLDDALAKSAPGLGRIIREIDAKNRKESVKTVPKYSYPPEVLTAAMVGYMAHHDTPFTLATSDAVFIRTLDAQRAKGKAIFGGGFLLSKKAAAEKAVAEKAVAEKWTLSDRERTIIEQLGG